MANEKELAEASIHFAQGVVRRANWKTTEAEEHFRKCAEIRRQCLGRGTETAMAIYEWVRQIWLQRTRKEECRQLATEALSMFQESLGATAPEVALTLSMLADFHIYDDDPEAHERWQELHHKATQIAQQKYDHLLHCEEDLDRRQFFEAQCTLTAEFGVAHTEFVGLLTGMANLHDDRGRSSNSGKTRVAEQLYERALLLLAKLDETEESLVPLHKKLSEFAKRSGQTTKAYNHIMEVWFIYKRIVGPSNLKTIFALTTCRGLCQPGSHEYVRITDKLKRVEICEEVEAAAKWWADLLRIRNPENDFSRDLNRRKQYFQDKPELVAFIEEVLGSCQTDVPEDQIEKFQRSLEREIILGMADYLPFYVQTNYHSDSVLEAALAEAGVSDTQYVLRFPAHGSTGIKVGNVTAGRIEGSPNEIIYGQ